MNQWSGEQSRRSKYGAKRRDHPLEISAEAGKADAEATEDFVVTCWACVSDAERPRADVVKQGLMQRV